jgi:selenide,water dikinase
MSELNKTASELMVRHGAHAATDVTGYGILGHAFEMADASNVTLELVFDRLPVLPNVLKYAEAGALTGGADANREYLEDRLSIARTLAKAQVDILYDAQTSGGLLIALPDKAAEIFWKDAKPLGLSIAEIGRVVEKQQFAVMVI